MSEEIKYDGILLIEADNDPRIAQSEAEALMPIQKSFMESYIANREKMSVDEWLPMELKNHLPDHNEEEIERISLEIISSIKVSEEKHSELKAAVKEGQSKESWLAREFKRATSAFSTQEASKYLQNLDSAVESANVSLHGTITTQAGVVSQNPNLDGFIAEQYHAQTFNLNAEATGSAYRAKVLEPTGTGYAKNSVDIVIVDGAGKTVKRYQCKYCKDAASTAKAFEKGDYRGQQKLVPENQGDQIPKRTSEVLEAPDGTTSNPLSKEKAKSLQDQAQSGKWNDLNWNEYKLKDLAVGIGKQAGVAAVMGAAIGAGTNVVKKVWDGEEIDGREVVEDALKTGGDFGIKAAAAGALKVGVEKGVIKLIPKGTPAGTIANIVHIGIENAKIVGKVVTGELSIKEGYYQMEQVSVSTAAGLAAGAKGTSIGIAVGSVLGPVGAAVGGFVGGTVGYMAGSAVGTTIIKGFQKVREKVHIGIQKASEKIAMGITELGTRLIDALTIL